MQNCFMWCPRHVDSSHKIACRLLAATAGKHFDNFKAQYLYSSWSWIHALKNCATSSTTHFPKASCQIKRLRRKINTIQQQTASAQCWCTSKAGVEKRGPYWILQHSIAANHLRLRCLAPSCPTPLCVSVLHLECQLKPTCALGHNDLATQNMIGDVMDKHRLLDGWSGCEQ